MAPGLWGYSPYYSEDWNTDPDVLTPGCITSGMASDEITAIDLAEEATKQVNDAMDELNKKCEDRRDFRERFMGKFAVGPVKLKPNASQMKVHSMDDLEKATFMGVDMCVDSPKREQLPIPKQHMGYYKSILKFYKLAYPEFFEYDPMFDDPYVNMPIHEVIKDIEQRIKIKRT